MAGTPRGILHAHRTSAKPIMVTTSPVTSGGSANRIRPITVPRAAWNRPAHQDTRP